MLKIINIVFVNIKDKQVIGADNVSIYPNDSHEVISRRLERIQEDGFNATKAVFSEGATWDFNFPMNAQEIEKSALKLFRNL